MRTATATVVATTGSSGARCRACDRRARSGHCIQGAMARADANRGFTLLEVLVAVAVLGLALVSLLGLHVRNIDLIARDERVTEATMLARGLMAEIDADTTMPQLGTTEGDFEDDYP